MEVFQFFFLPVPLELVSGVSVVLWGIDVILVRSRGLVQLTPIASSIVVHYFWWFIVVPRLLE